MNRDLTFIQSLHFVTLGGIIVLVASPISGRIFDRQGAYPLYFFAMVGAFGAWLILVVIQTKRSVLQEI